MIAGALLLPHMAAGSERTTMLYGCYAMFGLSLVASLNIIAMIWSRLTLYGRVAAAVAYAGLLFTWLLVTVRTARGSLGGNLLKVAQHRADQGA
ncbi:hypothetical protein A5624_17305 [Mycobacterium sp. 1482292.6]|nr:hypothetical protein A5624_17305 [Mycobacterium sp. 1482292.6]OBJ18019.1 hypothetical protein A5622_22300 [Mycobacterium sp. 1245801.1]OBJ85065.1 hypothetical protein A9W96_26580 [Mycobacterium sp. 1245852.3]